MNMPTAITVNYQLIVSGSGADERWTVEALTYRADNGEVRALRRPMVVTRFLTAAEALAWIERAEATITEAGA